jgi:hypothetical protein
MFWMIIWLVYFTSSWWKSFDTLYIFVQEHLTSGWWTCNNLFIDASLALRNILCKHVLCNHCCTKPKGQNDPSIVMLIPRDRGTLGTKPSCRPGPAQARRWVWHNLYDPTRCRYNQSVRSRAQGTLKPMTWYDVAQTWCLNLTICTSPTRYEHGLRRSRLSIQHWVMTA